MLDYFKFRWGDAWLSYGYGYDAILETSQTGGRINWLIDEAPFIMDLSGCEKEFMDLINECHIKNWNGNRYVNFSFEDGVLWEIVLGYSKSINIESKGMNAFPNDFEMFMKKLHSEWKLPYSEIDNPAFPFKEFRKGAVVERI